MTTTNGAGSEARLPRICVDGRDISGPRTGVSKYAENLMTALELQHVSPDRLISHSDGVDPSIRHGFLPLLRRLAIAAEPGTRRARSCGAGRWVAPDIFRQAQRHFDLYGKFLRVSLPAPPGIMHWTYPMPLRVVGWRNIYTVHDIIPLLQPELTSIDPKRHERLLRAMFACADRIVTVSQTVRRDIIDWARCDSDLVIDCGQGVWSSAPNDIKPLGFEAGGFYLALGAIEPRKNLARLARAHQASGSKRPLVLAGPRGWRAETVEAELAEISGVRILGKLPEASIAWLTKHARALLMPSLAEGFGLPIAEAMALGTPVMTSAFGATAEVAGDAGLLIDPYDEKAMAAAIARLDGDDAMCDLLGKAGRRHALRYSGEAHGRALIALYHDQPTPLGHLM